MEITTRSQPPRLTAAAELASRKLEAGRELHKRLAEFAARVLSPSAGHWSFPPPTEVDDSTGIGTLLQLDSLGSALPPRATHGPDASSKPFACSVRLVVRGQTAAEAVAQGSAMVEEVRASFARGKQRVSERASSNCESHVMWQNLGAHSIRLDPSKSNRINWLDKSWTGVTELDPSCAWPAQRALLTGCCHTRRAGSRCCSSRERTAGWTSRTTAGSVKDRRAAIRMVPTACEPAAPRLSCGSQST